MVRMQRFFLRYYEPACVKTRISSGGQMDKIPG